MFRGWHTYIYVIYNSAILIHKYKEVQQVSIYSGDG